MSRKKPILVVLSIILVASLAVAGIFAWQYFHPATDGGVSVTENNGKTTEEIKAELNQQVKDSMMTISVATKCEIRDGKVKVNVINVSDNKQDQSFELIQDDAVLYSSGLIQPGQTVEWCAASDAHAGEAYIRVSAHKSGESAVSGSPQQAKVVLYEGN